MAHNYHQYYFFLSFNAFNQGRGQRIEQKTGQEWRMTCRFQPGPPKLQGHLSPIHMIFLSSKRETPIFFAFALAFPMLFMTEITCWGKNTRKQKLQVHFKPMGELLPLAAINLKTPTKYKRSWGEMNSHRFTTACKEIWPKFCRCSLCWALNFFYYIHSTFGNMRQLGKDLKYWYKNFSVCLTLYNIVRQFF